MSLPPPLILILLPLSVGLFLLFLLFFPPSLPLPPLPSPPTPFLPLPSPPSFPSPSSSPSFSLSRCIYLSNQCYAIKVLQKKAIIRRNEVKHIMAERNVLLKNVTHPFLVGLHYSFQASSKLYFILDYVNGGELFFHLQRERGCLRNLGPGGWGMGGACTHICIVVVNPRRTCTARVTVVCLYLCVSVCLSARYPLTHSFCRLKARYQWLTNDNISVLNSWISLKMLHLEVMASFAYRKSHRLCYSDPELVPSTVQGYKLAEKPNRTPNATWNMSECNVHCSLGFLPLAFNVHIKHVHHARRGHYMCTRTHTRVFNPHAQSNRHSSLSTCYRKHKRIKKRAYEQRVREVEHASFTPLVLAETGGMANEATHFD